MDSHGVGPYDVTVAGMAGKIRGVTRSIWHRPLPILMAGAAIAALGGAGFWFAMSGPSGDPGGVVIGQLAPGAMVLPAGSRRMYLWKLEPRWDSCDGRSGTFGWSDVAVQSAFRWSGAPNALFAAASAHLRELGWRRLGTALGTSPPEQMWTKILTSGKTATLTVTQEGPSWQLYARAAPVGKAAQGC